MIGNLSKKKGGCGESGASYMFYTIAPYNAKNKSGADLVLTEEPWENSELINSFVNTVHNDRVAKYGEYNNIPIRIDFLPGDVVLQSGAVIQDIAAIEVRKPNFYLFGNGVNISAEGYKAVDIYDGSGKSIFTGFNIKSTNAENRGNVNIHYSNSSCLVTKNTIEGNVQFSGTVMNNTITGAFTIPSYTETKVIGNMFLSSEGDIILGNCVFSNNEVQSGVALREININQNCVFTNNRIMNSCSDYMILVTGTQNIISGNLISRANAPIGISISGGGSTIISGNSIRCSTAIKLDGGSALIMITGNYIDYSTMGIVAEESFGRNTISDNIIHCKTPGGTGSAIQYTLEEGIEDKSVILGNVCGDADIELSEMQLPSTVSAFKDANVCGQVITME